MARLEPEQDELLIRVVELWRRVPRQQRGRFLWLRAMGGESLIHPALRGEEWPVNGVDLEMLARFGFLDIQYTGRSQTVAVTPEGLEYYEALHRATGGDTELEKEVVRYLDSQDFALRHKRSLEKWSMAAAKLWSADSLQSLTAIGHDCREAMQFFADELVSAFPPKNPPSDPTHTVQRLKAVLAHLNPRFGKSESQFLDAVLSYWGAVGDLAQRQEHAGAREGEPLTWEDARRLVFQTAVVMFEIDRSCTQ